MKNPKYKYNKNKVLEDYIKGLSYDEISKKHKLSKSALANLIRKNRELVGKKRTSKKHFYDEKTLIKELKKGLTHKQIAKKLGISDLTIKYFVKKHPEYRRIKSHAYSAEKIKDDIKKGLLFKDIAKKHDIPLHIVSNISHKYRDELLKRKTGFQRKYEYDVKDIIKKFDNGMSAKEIAQQYGVDRTLIYNIIHSNRKKFPKKRKDSSKLSRKLFKNKIKEIIALYLDGLSLEKIGKIFNINKNTVRRILAQNNVPIRKLGAPIKALDTKAIVRLYKKKVPLIDIAKYFDVSLGTIERRLEDAGIIIYYHPESRPNPSNKNDKVLSWIKKQKYPLAIVVIHPLDFLMLSSLSFKKKNVQNNIPFLQIDKNGNVINYGGTSKVERVYDNEDNEIRIAIIGKTSNEIPDKLINRKKDFYITIPN